MPAQETISEQTRPAPKRRPCRRNAWTETPAIGARTTREGISTPPICQVSCRFTGIRAWYPGPVDDLCGAEYHPPPPEGWEAAGRFRTWADLEEAGKP